MFKRLTCIACCLLCLSTFTYAQKSVQKKEVVIEVTMKGGSTIFLNYWDELNLVKKLEFANYSKNDSVIHQTVDLQRPTHFTQGRIQPSPVLKTYTIQTDDFLLLPGDTLKLTSAGTRIMGFSYSGGTLQLNDLFWIPNSSSFEFQQYRQFKKNGYSAGIDFDGATILQRIKDSTGRSLTLINSLYQQRKLSESYYQALQKFSYLVEQNTIAIYSDIYPQLKENYKKMYSQLERLDDIGSRMNNNVVDFVFDQLPATKQGNSERYLFVSLPAEMKTKPAILHYLLNQVTLGNASKNKDSLRLQLDKLVKAGYPKKLFEDYYQEQLNKERRLNNLVASLEDMNGETLNLQAVMGTLRGKYVFVDMWASWCQPCISEMKYLQKVREELKNENIVFLTLSADNEKTRSAWVKASQKAGLDKEPYNFRFTKGMENEYLESNKINAVPRYLLFNVSGEIISSQFSMLSRPGFQEELLSYLKKKSN